MCHFITLIVPSDDTALLEAAMRRHGRRAIPVANRSVGAVLLPGEHAYLTKPGQCDCGTVLAPAAPAERDAAKEAAKLARKGWSEAKIARAMEGRGKAAAKPPRNACGSIAGWSAALGELLGPMRLPHAGLLVHFYSGSIEEEVFGVARRTVPADVARTEALASMGEDEVTIFRA